MASCNKQTYQSRKEAMNNRIFLKVYRSKHNGSPKYKKIYMNSYYCHPCQAWHLTTKKNK